MQATMALFREFCFLSARRKSTLNRENELTEDNFVSGFLVWVCLLECVIWWSLVTVCVYGESCSCYQSHCRGCNLKHLFAVTGWLGAVKNHYDWVEWYYE